MFEHPSDSLDLTPQNLHKAKIFTHKVVYNDIKNALRVETEKIAVYFIGKYYFINVVTILKNTKICR